MAVVEGMDYSTGGELLGTVKGSGKKPYEIYGHPGGVMRCSCPAWRFQRNKAPEDRSCKHIVKFNEVFERCEFVSDDPKVTFAVTEG